MSADRDDDLLPVRYVADHLGVSTSTVRRLIKTGVLGAVKLGPRLTRVPRGTYLAYKRALRDASQSSQVA